MQKYLFADESGNFDFRDHTAFKGATPYFAVGTLMIAGEAEMTALRDDLANLRYTLVEKGVPHHAPFHASEDPQHVRDAVFGVLTRHDFKVDVTLLEKAKAQPQTRFNDATFYKYAWYFHFKWFAPKYFQPNDKLMVVSAALGNKKTRNAFRTSVQDVVAQCCHYEVERKFGFWPASTDPCLQAVDYCLWAVMRELDGDNRSRKLIESKIRSVFDLWGWGNKYYYGPKMKTL